MSRRASRAAGAPRAARAASGQASPARPAPGRRLAIPSWAWPALACVVALVVRLIAWRAQPFITVDGSEYVRFAEALMGGHAYASIAPPGYPLLIAIARIVQPDRVLSAALVSCVCGALLPWPVWALARVRLGAAGAALPALAIAIHPELARYSAVAMSESAYLLALYGALALVTRNGLGSGLLLGAAYLIRPEALVPAGALAARGAWRWARGRTAPRQVLLGAAGFVALAVPCVLWYHATMGEWTPSPKLVHVHAAVTDWRTIEPRFEPAPRPAPEPFGARLQALAGNVPVNARAYFGWLMGLWPAPLALLSLAGVTRGLGVEAIPLLHVSALVAYSAAAQRFLFPLIPALALLAAFAWPRRFRWLAPGVVALALAGVAMLWAGSWRDFRRPLDGHFETHVDAGRWLHAHSEPGEPVADRKPYVAFYAGQRYVVLPDEPYDALIAWAVRTHVRWLVVDQGEAEIFRRQLQPLLYDAAFRDREPRLEIVYVGGRVAGYGLALFRVLQPGEAKTGQPPALEASWLPRR
jgi:hypothetical protein